VCNSATSRVRCYEGNAGLTRSRFEELIGRIEKKPEAQAPCVDSQIHDRSLSDVRLASVGRSTTRHCC